MWDARPEALKAYWTGRAVAVREPTGMRARFAGRVGRVRTVNMNGRCLVQFTGDDETWYDLDPRELVETEAPAEKTPPPVRPAVGEEPKGEPAPARPAGSPAKPADAKKLSVLELARMQGAARAGGAS